MTEKTKEQDNVNKKKIGNADINLCKKCYQMTNHSRQQHFYPEKKIIWKCLKCGNTYEEK